MALTWRQRALAALATAVVAAPTAVASADHDRTVDPVYRVACPSISAVSEASGFQLASLSATPTRCWYQASDENPHRIEFTFTRDASLGDARERVDGWSAKAEMVVAELPSVGEDAFAWTDASGTNLYWELSPGAVATLSGAGTPETTAKVAALFAPELAVYTVPGEHVLNGRSWRTVCDPYSTMARCRTEIWTTTLEVRGDRVVERTGWTFNSLTYRWSNRELWQGNPLAKPGQWTDAEGRKWRTECDTATTGRGACRTYYFGPVAKRVGGGYQVADDWVLNNQVLFS